LLGLLAVGVKVLFLPRAGVDGAPALTQPHDKTAPLTAEEEKVRRYVLDNANDAESVEFALWGPSASAATLKKLWEDASARYDEEIRRRGEAAKAKEDKVIAELRSKYRAATKAKAEEDKKRAAAKAAEDKKRAADKAKAAEDKKRAADPQEEVVTVEPDTTDVEEERIVEGVMPRSEQLRAKMFLDTQLNMQRIREENEAKARNNDPFRRALGAKASGVVRLRYRMKNRFGAKVLVDSLFVLFEDGTIIPIENPSGDKWAESDRGIGATVFAAEVKMSRQP
jgi:hypothetical protein